MHAYHTKNSFYLCEIAFPRDMKYYDKMSFLTQRHDHPYAIKYPWTFSLGSNYNNIIVIIKTKKKTAYIKHLWV